MAAAPSTVMVGDPSDPPPVSSLDHNQIQSTTAADGDSSKLQVTNPNVAHPSVHENANPATILDVAAQKPSFADVVNSGTKCKSKPVLHLFGQPAELPGAELICRDGCDIVMFNDEATKCLAASFKWALIGKFSHELPNRLEIGKFLYNMGLRGNFDLKWINKRQIFINLNDEEDYARIWVKGLWYIGGCPMRVLKWTPLFDVASECSIVPIWVSLPNLPVHLFEKRALHFIASTLGRPVMLDAPTANRSLFSVARICVEIDLLSPLKEVITLSINDRLVLQPVVYENLPYYCIHCHHIGHNEEDCFVKYNDLKPGYDELQDVIKKKKLGKENLMWVVKPNTKNLSTDCDTNDLVVPSNSVSQHNVCQDQSADQQVLENLGSSSSNTFNIFTTDAFDDDVEEGELVASPKQQMSHATLAENKLQSGKKNKNNKKKRRNKKKLHVELADPNYVLKGPNAKGSHAVNYVEKEMHSGAFLANSGSCAHSGSISLHGIATVQHSNVQLVENGTHTSSCTPDAIGVNSGVQNIYKEDPHDDGIKASIVHGDDAILSQNSHATVPTTCVDRDNKSGKENGPQRLHVNVPIHAQSGDSFVNKNRGVQHFYFPGINNIAASNLNNEDQNLGNKKMLQSGSKIVAHGKDKDPTACVESFSPKDMVPFLDMSAFDHLINKSVIEAPFHAKPLQTRFPGTCYSDGDVRNSDDESDYEFEDEEEDKYGYSSRGDEYIDW